LLFRFPHEEEMLSRISDKAEIRKMDV